LAAKTAVIIGVAGIASQIAQRAGAFGMNVIGVDPRDIPLSPYVSKTVTPDRLDSVLPQADVIFVSAPHTPQSEGMVGSKQFAEMKKGAYFIAVSRGKLYDTQALVKALDEQRLAGAGLDVTNPEPLTNFSEPETTQSVYVEDVSEGGVRLAMAKQLECGALVRLQIADSTLYCEVRYCRRGGAAYTTGLLVERVLVGGSDLGKLIGRL